MKQTILKKIAFLVVLTGLALFSQSGQVKAQQTLTSPEFKIKLYAVDGTTGGAINSATKTISIGAVLTNDAASGYAYVTLVANSYHLYNQTPNKVWSSNVDTFPGGGEITVNNVGQYSSYNPGYFPAINTKTNAKLTLKNTSTQTGLVGSVDLTIVYNATNNPVTAQYIWTTVTDVIYMPSTTAVSPIECPLNEVWNGNVCVPIVATCQCTNTPGACGSNTVGSLCAANQRIVTHTCNPQGCDAQPSSYCEFDATCSNKIVCPVGQVLNASGTACACPAGKIWNGSACV